MASSYDASAAQAIADDCCRSGFAAIGITITSRTQIIDFSTIDDQMCADVATSIELCVDARGYFVPALTGTLQVLQQEGVTISFGDFAGSIAQMIKPKSAVLGGGAAS